MSNQNVSATLSLFPKLLLSRTVNQNNCFACARTRTHAISMNQYFPIKKGFSKSILSSWDWKTVGTSTHVL